MTDTLQSNEATEKHLDVTRIAELWSVDRKTVTRYFRDEPGVLRIQGKQRESLRVPLSVIERVHRRLSGRG
jgi:hypothetical protein